MTVVVDTNVLVSALLIPAGNEAQILEHWARGDIDFAASPNVLDEYRRVLQYPHIVKHPHWSCQDSLALVDTLAADAINVSGKVPVSVVQDDPSDNKFIACAIEAEADAIVSGDQHLLKIRNWQGIPILTPRQFLDSMKRMRQAA